MQVARDKATGFDRNAYQRQYMQSARSGLHHIYVIGGDTPPMKIGIAQIPTDRLAQMQTESPVKLTLYAAWAVNGKASALRTEHAVHLLLRDRHSHGEWFNVSPDEAIAAVHSLDEPTRVDHTAFVSRPPPLAPWDRSPFSRTKGKR